ncbi:MAG: glycosyltransferase [Rhodobacter sp.]|nr:glycosyltransferase [Rhodobacter sp.]
MPGAGTRTDGTTAEIPARCLDLTRLISRQGRGPLTGVDRVELAYLRRLVDDPVPLFLLVATRLGFVLLDGAGAQAVLDRIERRVPWGAMDMIGRFRRKSPAGRRRAEADARRLSIARCRPGGLAEMLRAHLPPGAAYLNTGHSNLSDAVLRAWKDAVKGRASILVHDMIPLDFPQFQRPAVPQAFAAKMRSVSAHADLAIYNSRATRDDAERWFAEWGRRPDGVVAHLGVELPAPDPSHLPEGLDLGRPYFLTLGTIEPRKNHALLLDVWETLATELSDEAMPVLIIAGSRGWENEALFRRLDSSPLMGRHVVERAGLADAAVAALMAGAAGMLFPSLAEGFGLPPLEAASLGVPVVCNRLPVYEELLGNIPVYAESGDVYLWAQTITKLVEKRQAEHVRTGANPSATVIPTWADHFNLVLKVT